MFDIEGSVGKGGANKPIDVAIIQKLFSYQVQLPLNYDPFQVTMPNVGFPEKVFAVETEDGLRARSKWEVDLDPIPNPACADPYPMTPFPPLPSGTFASGHGSSPFLQPLLPNYIKTWNVEWPNLGTMVSAFQLNVVGTINPDGRIDPKGKTFKTLLEAAGKMKLVEDNLDHFLFGKPLTNGKTIMVHTDYLRFEQSFNKLMTLKSGHALKTVYNYLKNDDAMNDIRWVAYALATTYHETAYTMKPIEEYGKGAGKPYGDEVELVDDKGKTVKHTYYGRGYIQLTHHTNYKNLGDKISEDLEFQPEKALEAAVAYKIMSYFFLNAIPGVKSSKIVLSRYINDAMTDYVNARRIINGTDKASTIAKYATDIERLLRLHDSRVGYV